MAEALLIVLSRTLTAPSATSSGTFPRVAVRGASRSFTATFGPIDEADVRLATQAGGGLGQQPVPTFGRLGSLCRDSAPWRGIQVVLPGNGHRARSATKGAQHGWRSTCSAKPRRAQRRRAGRARRMGSSYPVHRALFSFRLHSRHRVGVHPCPAVVGDCSRRR